MGFYSANTKADAPLAAGGLYAARLTTPTGTHTRLFKIDSRAEPGSTPIVGRLLSFGQRGD